MAKQDRYLVTWDAIRDMVTIELCTPDDRDLGVKWKDAKLVAQQHYRDRILNYLRLADDVDNIQPGDLSPSTTKDTPAASVLPVGPPAGGVYDISEFSCGISGLIYGPDKEIVADIGFSNNNSDTGWYLLAGWVDGNKPLVHTCHRRTAFDLLGTYIHTKYGIDITKAQGYNKIDPTI